MITTIHDVHLHKVLKTISREIDDGKYTFICDETSIRIPLQLGEGYIKGINFQHGLGLLQLHFTLKEPLTLHYKLDRSHPLRIISCHQGKVSYMFEPEYCKHTVEALHTSLATCTDKFDQSLIFEAGCPIQVTILEIDRPAYLPKIACELYTIPERLAAVFKDVDAIDPFEYHTAYSLQLADVIAQIHDNDLNGLSRKIFLEAKALEIFGLMIQLYVDDYGGGKTSSLLRKADIALIHHAEKTLTADLKDTPTIPELAKMVGVNTTKLKHGFKIVFGTTINKYLREKKLLHAASLFTSDTLNIRQIADHVGYSNPAHFSQLFKDRFGALPSEYVKTMKRKLTVDNE